MRGYTKVGGFDDAGQLGAYIPPQVYGGPGPKSAAAMLFASQFQADRYGQAWSSPDSRATTGTAFNKPGGDFGSAYLHTRFDSTRQGATTPPGAYLQQDVPLRAAEAARALALALQGRGIRLTHRAHRLPGRVVAYGLVFRVTPGSVPIATQLAGTIAETNNLYAVMWDLTPAGNEQRHAIYFTANPGAVQGELSDKFDVTRINGFLVEDLRGGPRSAGLHFGDESGATDAAPGTGTSNTSFRAGMGGIVGGALVAIVSLNPIALAAGVIAGAFLAGQQKSS